MEDPEILLEDRRFKVVRKVWVDPDGIERAGQIICHPGAVAILPLVDDGRICLIRNHRYAVDEQLVEIPAGTLEPGEDPLRAAHRELAEETGYRARSMERLTTFYTSPGILDERMTLFLATGLTPGPMKLEPGEHLVAFLADWDEALEMIRDGRIRDAKTLAGLLYYGAFGRDHLMNPTSPKLV